MSLDVKNWKEYIVGKLFDQMYKAKAYVKGDMVLCEQYDSDAIRFITRTDNNNGCDCYVVNNELSGIEQGNAIIIGDTTSTLFYQQEHFVAGDHIVVCRANWLNKYTAIFIKTIFEKDRYRYSYGRAFKIDVINSATIKLPSLHDNNGNIVIDENKRYSDVGYIPDWTSMENYVMSLKYKPLTTNNQTGTISTLAISNWEEFTVSDIFKMHNGKGITQEEIECNEGDFVAVQSGEENNGIIGKIDKNYCVSMEYTMTENPCLTVARSGSAGFISYQPFGCVVGDSAKILELREKEKGSPYVYLFLKTILMANKFKYSYGRKVTETKYLQEKIMLPVVSKGVPDYDFMEKCMKTLPFGDRVLQCY